MSRKHRHSPALITRAQAAAMIAAAVAGERERSDRIMARISLALGDTYKVLDQVGDVVIEHQATITRHAAFIEPMVGMVAANFDVREGSEPSAAEGTN